MIIESKRLILRNWKDSDIQDLVEGLNNINVSKWMVSVPFPYTEKDAKNFIEYAKQQDENYKISLAIVLKEKNKVIGGTEIRNIDKRNGTAGGGIWLNEKYQKNGYGTEAIKMILEYGFKYLNLHSIRLDLLSINERAHKCYLKCGFKDAGVGREQIFLNGKYYDKLHMDILENEFEGDYIRNKNIQ